MFSIEEIKEYVDDWIRDILFEEFGTDEPSSDNISNIDYPVLDDEDDWDDSD